MCLCLRACACVREGRRRRRQKTIDTRQKKGGILFLHAANINHAGCSRCINNRNAVTEGNILSFIILVCISMANSSRGSSVRDQHHRHQQRGGHYHYHDHVQYRKRPDPDSCFYKVKEFGRKLTAFLFGHVGICGLVVGYIIMGAFAFQAIESEGTKKKYEDVVRLREQTITNLWNITNELNVLYPSEWNESVALQVLQFQRKIVQFVLEGYDGKHYQINRTQLLQQFGEFDIDQSSNPSVVTSTADPNGSGSASATGNPGAWSFSASFLYCLTVITTIGKTVF